MLTALVKPVHEEESLPCPHINSSHCLAALSLHGQEQGPFAASLQVGGPFNAHDNLHIAATASTQDFVPQQRVQHHVRKQHLAARACTTGAAHPTTARRFQAPPDPVKAPAKQACACTPAAQVRPLCTRLRAPGTGRHQKPIRARASRVGPPLADLACPPTPSARLLLAMKRLLVMSQDASAGASSRGRSAVQRLQQRLQRRRGLGKLAGVPPAVQHLAQLLHLGSPARQHLRQNRLCIMISCICTADVPPLALGCCAARYRDPWPWVPVFYLLQAKLPHRQHGLCDLHPCCRQTRKAL